MLGKPRVRASGLLTYPWRSWKVPQEVRMEPTSPGQKVGAGRAPGPGTEGAGPKPRSRSPLSEVRGGRGGWRGPPRNSLVLALSALPEVGLASIPPPLPTDRVEGRCPIEQANTPQRFGGAPGLGPLKTGHANFPPWLSKLSTDELHVPLSLAWRFVWSPATSFLFFLLTPSRSTL